MKKLLSVILIFIAIKSNASHIVGGQITSRCLGGLTQEVTLTLYRDVQGIPMPNSVNLDYTSNNFTWTQSRIVFHGNPYTINPLIEAYDFVDTITVPYVDYYTVGYTTCCRSLQIVNMQISGSSNIYIDMIALFDSTCNSTPIMPVAPYGYAYINVPFVLNLNAYDLDGDSLGYQLVTPMAIPGGPAQGYVFPQASISANGIFTMTSNNLGTYDVCVKVTEYRNGVEIGYVRREMTIMVSSTTGIDEPYMLKDNNIIYYDLLGRKINPSYNSIRIHN